MARMRRKEFEQRETKGAKEGARKERWGGLTTGERRVGF
jgi:hypothetical protein